MAGEVLELVVFELVEGATREQLLATVDPVSAWIGEQPGFVSRELVHDAEGDRWIDVVWWESMEQAHAASERAMSSESCAPMFALIDMESTLMVHGERAIEPVRA
jgi:antibiotic biosynthesis monooxygenase (ABM) superfamily enzyme